MIVVLNRRKLHQIEDPKKVSCTTIWQIPQGWESSYHLQRCQGRECSKASRRPGGQNREREEERQSVG